MGLAVKKCHCRLGKSSEPLICKDRGRGMEKEDLGSSQEPG